MTKVHIYIRTTDFDASGFGGNGGKPPTKPPRKGRGPWDDGDDDGEGRDRAERMNELLLHHSNYESIYNHQHRFSPHAGLNHLADKHGAAIEAIRDNVGDLHDGPTSSEEDAAHVKSREAIQASYLHHLAHGGEHHAGAARNFGRALTANNKDVNEHLYNAHSHVMNSRRPPWFKPYTAPD